MTWCITIHIHSKISCDIATHTQKKKAERLCWSYMYVCVCICVFIACIHPYLMRHRLIQKKKDKRRAAVLACSVHCLAASPGGAWNGYTPPRRCSFKYVIYIYIYICMYTYTYTYTCKYVYIYICIYIYINMCVCVYMYMYVRACVDILYVYICIYIDIYVCIDI